MDIANRSATSRMKSLFIQYHSLLAKQGLSWIISDNQKLAVSHVLSAIGPNYLKERLESDLNFSHYNLKKDFNGFLLHVVKVSKAFQIVDAGRRKRNRNDGKDADKNQTGKMSPGIPKPEPDGSTEVPLFLWPPHATKGYRHLLKDCKNPLLKKRRSCLPPVQPNWLKLVLIVDYAQLRPMVLLQLKAQMTNLRPKHTRLVD